MLKALSDSLDRAFGITPAPAMSVPGNAPAEHLTFRGQDGGSQSGTRPSERAAGKAGASSSRKPRTAPAEPLLELPISKLTVKERKRMATRAPSFTDLLPWAYPEPSDRVIHHVDGMTQGVMLEIIPAPTEALPDKVMETLRRMTQISLQSLDEVDRNPWIVQFFVSDDRDLDPVKRAFVSYIESAYPKDKARSQKILRSAYTQDFIAEFCRHLDQVSRPQGLFVDTQVTGQVWRGQVRRVRCMLYRKFDGDKETSSPRTQLDHAAATLMESITKSGVRVRRCKGRDLYEFLLPFFNRRPSFAKNAGDLLQKMPYPFPSPEDDATATSSTGRSQAEDDGHTALLGDFADAISLAEPRSDDEGGWWEFDGMKVKALVLQNLVRRPTIGHFTSETKRGDTTFALFDRLPTGSMLSMTVVIEPQHKVRQRIEAIERKSQAKNADAAVANAEAKRVLSAMAYGNKLFPTTMTLYVNAETQEELSQHITAVNAELGPSGLRFIDPRHDLAPLDAFIRGLPMAFDPAFDSKFMRRARLVFASEIAALLPLYGRARGTGRPGFCFWNRGGEPIFYDPLSAKDRKKNAHLLMLGPTGAGKSATLNYLCMLIMAVYRPRLVIVDAGKSFGLLVEHFKSLGLSTHCVEMSTDGDVSLPPFVHAARLLDDPDIMESFRAAEKQGEDSTAWGKLTEDPTSGLDAETRPADLDTQPAALDKSDDAPSERRDFLGEMMISAIMMITGGEKNEIERMTRADRYLISRAIIAAAIKARQRAKPHPLTHDVALELMSMQGDTGMSGARRQRAEEMGQAMMSFTSALRGKLFNRFGSDWPEVDVTLVELGTLVQDGYNDALTLSYTGIIDSVQSRGERFQYEGRPLVMLTDEAHLVTTSDLLGPKVAKATKMWRKLNIWLWLATQNMKDFPDSMSRVLSMCEWWLMLTMDKSEIEEVARFRSLSAEQRAMMESAVKEPPKYTEGVTLSSAFTGLFRNVPPPLSIALAMTEGHEKADRMRLMKEHGISEVQAARLVAKQLEANRA